MASTRPIQPRTRLQWEQKKIYREKLVAAADALFCRRSYGAVSVDDIAKRARVSRATFYRHFTGKLDVFAALTDRFVVRLQPAQDVFGTAQHVDTEIFMAWIGLNLDLFRKNAALVGAIREAAAAEPVFFRDHAAAHIDHEVERLGQVLPAFRRAGSHAPAERMVRMQAHYLIRALQTFCYDVAVTGWGEGVEAGTLLLARQFMAFVEEHGEALQSA
ncbi:MAG TPA: helix-turn-helix domain-containing protein [Nevskiaceae bacterium]|nr:helix-turn-helix domain-containing protein [Nevskiaceae bacterium]